MIHTSELARDYTYPWEYSEIPEPESSWRQKLDSMSKRVRDGVMHTQTTLTQSVAEAKVGVRMLSEDIDDSKEDFLDRVAEVTPDLISLTKYATVLALPVAVGILSQENLSVVQDRTAAWGLFAASLISAATAIYNLRKPELDSLPKLRKQDPRW